MPLGQIFLNIYLLLLRKGMSFEIPIFSGLGIPEEPRQLNPPKST